ncbi:MAG: tetratricopeptide repeat protein [Deltaproteobacteria bacterium]|nr:tetratricopeptide repeat protein [Deltaproteobacteria bacterium]
MSPLRQSHRGLARAWKLQVTLVALGLFLCTSQGFAQSRRRFSRLVSQAAEAYNRNEPDVAINLLDQAYTLDPQPLLLYNIGRSHELAGRLDRALEFYDRFLATHPDEAQAQLGREARTGVQTLLDARGRSQNPNPNTTGAGPTVSSLPPPPEVRWEERPRRLSAGQGVLMFGGASVAIAGGVLGGLALLQSGGFADTADPAQRAGFQDRGTGFAWGSNAGIGVGLTSALSGLLWYMLQPTRVRIETTAPRPDGSIM